MGGVGIQTMLYQLSYSTSLEVSLKTLNNAEQ
jgi:hypothetical protein